MEFADVHSGRACMGVPGAQPFEACKLVLQSEELYGGEAERAEAQVAALGSLFLASVFSLISALFSAHSTLFSPHFIGSTSWQWIVSSLVIAIVLGISFHIDRRGEVNRIYRMTLLFGLREQQGKSPEIGRPDEMRLVLRLLPEAWGNNVDTREKVDLMDRRPTPVGAVSSTSAAVTAAQILPCGDDTRAGTDNDTSRTPH